MSQRQSVRAGQTAVPSIVADGRHRRLVVCTIYMPVACTRALPSDKTGPAVRRCVAPHSPSIGPFVRWFGRPGKCKYIDAGPRESRRRPGWRRDRPSAGAAHPAAGDGHHAAAAAMDPRSNIAPSQLRARARRRRSAGVPGDCPSRVSH